MEIPGVGEAVVQDLKILEAVAQRQMDPYTAAASAEVRTAVA